MQHLGTYHYCSAKPVSWYEFASAILTQATESMSLMMEELQAITTTEYPTPAKRPAYAVLNCKKIKKDYGIEQRTWETAVDLMLKMGN